MLNRIIAVALYGVGLTAQAAMAQSSDSAAAGEPKDGDEEIVVTARYSGFSSTVTDTALKSPIAIKEVPQSVTVITNELLQDLNVHDAKSIIGFISSASIYNEVGGATRFVLRGRQVDLLNGYKLDGAPFLYYYTPDFSTLETIEVVKGPSSTLYGRGSGTGVLNLVGKKPGKTEFLHAGAELGLFEHYRAEFDWNKPLADGVGARIVAYGQTDGQSRGSTYKTTKRDSIGAYGAFAYEIAPTTKIGLEANYQSDTTNGYDTGLAAYLINGTTATLPPILRRDTYQGASGNQARSQSLIAVASIVHDFSPSTSLTVKATYARINRSLNYTVQFGAFDPLVSQPVYYLLLENNISTNYATEADLVSKWHLNDVEGSFLIGADYSRQPNSYKPRNDFDNNFFGAPIGSDPELLNPPSEFYQRANAASYTERDQSLGYGIYAQATAKVGPLLLLAGARHDTYKNRDQVFTLSGPEPRTSYKKTAVTYRGGITLTLSKAINVYASYSTGFNPNGARDRDGEALTPERAKNIEGGLKIGTADNRISGTLALFRTKISNVAIGDPTDLTGRFSVAAGSALYKGVEGDLSLSPFRGLNVLLSGSVLDTGTELEKQDGDGIVVASSGAFASATPSYTASAFVRYQFPSGPFFGSGFSFGLEKTGRQYVDLNNRLRLPAYTLLNGSLFHQFTNARLEVFAQNILDKKFYQSGSGSIIDQLLLRGNRRSINARLSVDFK